MAVALPSAPTRIAVLDLRGTEAPRREGGPLASVCGLPVLVRNLLLLQRRGYTRALLLVSTEHTTVVERALSSRPLMMPVELVTSAPAALPAADIVLYWPGTLSFGRTLPDLATAVPEPGELLAAARGSDDGAPYVFRAPFLPVPGDFGISRLVEEYRAAGRVGLREESLASRFVRAREDVRAAERDLLVSLRKGADGVVAHFDRYISLAISHQLMKLPVTPNMATLAAGGLALLAALLAARGGYWPMLAGAVLFQLNSIFDGIDGEIARAKLLESRLGQWLDTIVDDVSNCAFAVGAAIGAYRNSGSPVYLELGGAAAAGFVIAAAFMYHYLVTVAHSGDLNDFRMPWDAAGSSEPARPAANSGLFARLFSAIRFLGRRDAFTFINTVLAVFGLMHVMVWLFAAGAVYLAGSIAIGHLMVAFQKPGERVEP